MMKQAFALMMVSLFIYGCSPVYKTEYKFQAPPTMQGKQCASTCLDKMQICQANCNTQQAECRRAADLEAENAYLKYVNAREREGSEIKKDVTDFRRFNACDGDMCTQQCGYTQRVCHVNCGGQVQQEQHCTAFCDQ